MTLYGNDLDSTLYDYQYKINNSDKNRSNDNTIEITLPKGSVINLINSVNSIKTVAVLLVDTHISVNEGFVVKVGHNQYTVVTEYRNRFHDIPVNNKPNFKLPANTLISVDRISMMKTFCLDCELTNLSTIVLPASTKLQQHDMVIKLQLEDKLLTSPITQFLL